MGLITKLFGTYSEREIKKIISDVDKIEALADKYKQMPEEELCATTQVLKERLANGETLDDILPDAFAAVREAADRVLGKRPFRVQLIGGIIIAIALVLPGISVSHMLYILGIYESVMHSVYSFHWFNLVPLVLGVVVGIFATTNIIEKLLKKYPDKVYMTIIGFVTASLITLI